jgi:hypothetical protein
MILLLAIISGWLLGLVISQLNNEKYQLPELSAVWIVLAAVFPQLLIFHISATALWFSDFWAKAVLVLSQGLLLVFVWLNRKQAGFPILGLGLVLNLLVIILNQGLMPLAPETAHFLFPDTTSEAWIPGSRPGRSKNIILAVNETRLPWLSDSILTPGSFPIRRALSPGDILISLGVIWFLITGNQNFLLNSRMKSE